jgi:hypothetical protein
LYQENFEVIVTLFPVELIQMQFPFFLLSIIKFKKRTVCSFLLFDKQIFDNKYSILSFICESILTFLCQSQPLFHNYDIESMLKQDL